MMMMLGWLQPTVLTQFRNGCQAKQTRRAYSLTNAYTFQYLSLRMHIAKCRAVQPNFCHLSVIYPAHRTPSLSYENLGASFSCVLFQSSDAPLSTYYPHGLPWRINLRTRVEHACVYATRQPLLGTPLLMQEIIIYMFFHPQFTQSLALRFRISRVFCIWKLLH